MSEEVSRRKFLGAAAGALAAGALGAAAAKFPGQGRPILVSKTQVSSTLPVLKCDGPNLVNAATGATVFSPSSPARGFDIQPIHNDWTTADYDNIASKATLMRVLIFWDVIWLDSYGKPKSATDYGGIDTTTYIPTMLDPLVNNLASRSIHMAFSLYYGPGGNHAPSWLPGTGSAKSQMSNYVTYGQSVTQYLANRYGNPSSPQYQPAVIGFGLNEITPDKSTINTDNCVNNLFGQQGASMMTWMRASGFAPNWIADICSGYGATAPYRNAPDSGHTPTTNNQTFTTPAKTVFSGYGNNFFLSIHDYFMCLTTATADFDGRDQYGAVNNSVTVKAGNTSYPNYPPGGMLTRSVCRGQQQAYIAPYVAWCAPSFGNVPLMVTESGWVPYDGVPFSGEAEYAADKATEFKNANATGVLEWDYDTDQSKNPWAAFPGTGQGVHGANPDGWQTWTDDLWADPV
jgi:hypothetical protein